MSQRESNLDDLIIAYLSGHASEQQVAELESLILSDEEVRRKFLRHSRMDAALGATNLPELSIPEPSKIARFPKHKILAVAAALAILGIITTLIINQSSGVKATIVDATGSVLKQYAPGKEVKLSRLVFPDGSLKVRLLSGVTLEMNGPHHTQFITPMQIMLNEGSVTANVGVKGKGFVVETPNTRVIDLGTRFGVSLSENGDTDVVVMSGEVEIYRPKVDNQHSEFIAKLGKGDAVRVNSKYVTRRLAAVSLEGKSLAILDGDHSKIDVVTDVSDSIRKADFKRFYSILPGGMAPGTRAYSTLGKPRWKAQENQSFPDELIGADVVGTFSADRFDRNLELSVTLSRAATVYVMLDARSEAPDWLKKDFTKTSHLLRCGPWGISAAAKDIPPSADGNRYVTYQVWSQEIDQPGVVILGPSFQKKRKENYAMYGIAVKGRD